MDPSALHSAYMASLLGQRDVPAALPEGSPEDFRTAFLRADCFWVNGRASEALEVLDSIPHRVDPEGQEAKSLLMDGLRGLCAGDLEKAYVGYAKACAVLTGEPDHGSCDGHQEDHHDLAVFSAERAVNVAFWQACAGKMLSAAKPISVFVESKPFAGGVLSFAHHMVGDSLVAEEIARKAIAKGHSDPWTLHAVAHALYSLGRVDECAVWLHEARPQLPADISVFMRTHFEFHLALCLVDLERGKDLWELIREGGLWGKLEKQERRDYWAATGPLNALWKAELRGVTVGEDATSVLTEIFTELDASDVNVLTPGKSKVFSLCQLRWHLFLAKHPSSPMATGTLSDHRISAGLPASILDHEVLHAVVDAMEAAYGSDSDGADNSWNAAAGFLKPVLERLHELGASPEQREVVEEFAAVVLARAGEAELLGKWLEKNRRAHVSWYDRMSAPGGR